MTAPQVGVLTAVSMAHTEGLGDLNDVVAEKTSLFEALPADGVAVYNADHPELRTWAQAHPSRHTVSFGSAQGADVRLLEATPEGLRTRCTYDVGGAPQEVSLQLIGRAAAVDAGAALAVVRILHGDEALPAAARALGQVRAFAGRLSPVELSSGALVLDDTYNANPASMRASMAAAAELAASRGGALHLVLGDMKELGTHAANEHGAVVRLAVAGGAASIHLVGPEMQAAAHAEGDPAPVVTSAELPAVSDIVLGPADVLLVKGSRSMRMERLVEALQ
jgi:UDP-N-acetylmuramoyl-tripeptide--D-alanyl-D-alanine ligase